MPDFSKMASGAKAASDDRVAKALKEQARADAARSHKFQCAVDVLLHDVQPTFETAVNAFASQDIPTKITNNWSGYARPMSPAISFQCVGPEVQNKHGGHEIPEGVPIVASYDEGKAHIKVGNSHRHSPKIVASGGDLTDAIPPAIQLALDTYLADLERIKTSL